MAALAWEAEVLKNLPDSSERVDEQRDYKKLLH